MWKILDGIPVVGHAKGLVNYACGDVEAGNRAMKEATRSSAVMAAGAVGFAGGPGGSMALGALAGAAWDSVESAATGEAKGLVAGVEGIAKGSAKGELPIGALLQTTLTVTGDVLGGLGGGSIVGSVTQSTAQVATGTAGKAAGQSAGKAAGKAAGDNILKSASYSAGETFGKGAARQAVGQTVTKGVAKEAVKTVVLEETVTAATYGTTRAIIGETEDVLLNGPPAASSGASPPRRPPPRADREGTQPSGGATGGATGSTSGAATGDATGDATGGGAGRDPNRRETQTNPSQTLAPLTPELQALVNYFGVQTLAEITIRAQHTFAGTNRSQRDYLTRKLQPLVRLGMLDRVLETIVNVFNTVDEGDVTFVNFLSLLEFVLQFLEEMLLRQYELLRLRTEQPDEFEARRREAVRLVGVVFSRHDYTIVRAIRAVLEAVRRQPALPVPFRDDYAASYHYYKHRFEGDVELTVEQYWELARQHLVHVLATPEFAACRRGGRGVAFTRYCARLAQELFLKISRIGRAVVLSTVYWRDPPADEDEPEDGAMQVNGRPLPPPPPP